MSTEHHTKIRRIFLEACRLEGAERIGFLNKACAGDSDVRAEIDLLLAADEEDLDGFGGTGDGGELLAHALASDEELAMSADGPADWLPTAIGGYRIVRLIGRGGMGIVYEAEQESPKRRVAIKLLHPMLATPDNLRRFRNEARTLGKLRHPRIAQIHESGTYDAGRGPQPFFAMELVDGLDVLTHVERQGIDRAGRLELLAKVADAVQYAHDQGVVHRDLKPDNVLMDEFGEPRILDFGIARVRGDSETMSTIVTGEGALVGTLAYMAPEQLEGQKGALQHLVDVYALGVIGYQLVVGRLPREIADLSLSQAITLLARSTAPPAGSFDPSLKGDVETILSKALESEPARRYASAAELAGDLRRHLDHQPIRAKPPSRVYLARKFARRHRGLVAGTLAAVVALIVGLAVSLHFAESAREQRDLARENEMRAVNGLLQSTQTLLSAGRIRDADEQLNLIDEEHRGFAWSLLDRQTPHFLEVRAGHWTFLDDENVVGTPVSESNLGSAVHVYSLTEQRTTRVLFEGERIERIMSVDASGVALASSVDQLTRGRISSEVVMVDIDSEAILDRWPVTNATENVEPPEGRSWRQWNERSKDTAAWFSRTRIDEVSSDGRTLLRYDGPERAVVTVDGETRWTFDDLGALETVRISRDGRLLVVNRKDDVSAYDLETRTHLFRMPLSAGDWASALPVQGGILLHSAPDTTFASTWDAPRAWKLFELGTGPLPLTPVDPFADAFASPSLSFHTSVSFPSDGRFLAVGNAFSGLGNGILFGDTTTGAALDSPLFTTGPGGTGGWLAEQGVSYPNVHVSPSGRRALVGQALDGFQVVEFDARAGEPDFDPRFIELRGHADEAGSPGSGWVYHVAVSNDGSLIASHAPMDPYIRVWDARRGDCIARLERGLAVGAGETEELLAFTTDDERLVAGMRWVHQPMVGVWDLLSGEASIDEVTTETSATYAIASMDAFVSALEPRGRARLNQRAQLFRGRVLATSYYLRRFMDPTYEWSQPTSGQSWTSLPGMDGCATGLSVHPRESRLAVVRCIPNSGFAQGKSGTLEILDADSFEPEIERTLGVRPWCVAYSPDGATLAIGGHDGQVLLFETEGMTQQLDFQAHDTYVFAIAWTPDGTRLVTASGDETIKLWDSRPRPASRLEYERWSALREEMHERDDLRDVYESLTGEERQAARIELMMRAQGEDG